MHADQQERRGWSFARCFVARRSAGKARSLPATARSTSHFCRTPRNRRLPSAHRQRPCPSPTLPPLAPTPTPNTPPHPPPPTTPPPHSPPPPPPHTPPLRTHTTPTH